MALSPVLVRGFSTNAFKLSMTNSRGAPPIYSNASAKNDSKLSVVKFNISRRTL